VPTVPPDQKATLQPGCIFYFLLLPLTTFQQGKNSMQKGIRNTGLIFLWIAGLVFLLHSFMPHHHHFDGSFEHNDLTGLYNEVPDNAPIHCHAFNNVVVYKGENTNGQILNHHMPVAIISASAFTDAADKAPAGTTILIPSGKCFSGAYLKTSPTRGSPVYG
jgi:hypothetical protein